MLAGVESAAVKDVKDRKAQGEFNTHTDTHTHTHTHTPNPTLFSYSIALAGASKRVFMPESDASNFFKRRGRRSPKMYEEYYGECSKTLLFSISVLLSHYLCNVTQYLLPKLTMYSLYSPPPPIQRKKCLNIGRLGVKNIGLEGPTGQYGAVLFLLQTHTHTYGLCIRPSFTLPANACSNESMEKFY